MRNKIILAATKCETSKLAEKVGRQLIRNQPCEVARGQPPYHHRALNGSQVAGFRTRCHTTATRRKRGASKLLSLMGERIKSVRGLIPRETVNVQRLIPCDA
jgi:hypothetical protein